MGLFDRGGERGFFKRREDANQLYDKGEYPKARARYERLVQEATQQFGADDANTLHVRACQAGDTVLQGRDPAEAALAFG